MSFGQITASQIDGVEKFVRESMQDYLIRKTAEKINETDKDIETHYEDVLLSDDLLVEHFGEIYALQPMEFRFQPGDRLLIEQLVIHVKK